MMNSLLTKRFQSASRAGRYSGRGWLPQACDNSPFQQSRHVFLLLADVLTLFSPPTKRGCTLLDVVGGSISLLEYPENSARPGKLQ